MNNKDMIFEFSGDDDVLIYIDDKLVLDLGGTHNKESGTINFATGKITYGNEAYHDATSTGGASWMGKDRYTGNKDLLNFNQIFGADTLNSNGTFNDNTTHTFKMFYLERGGAVSNCKMKFNMQTIPSNSVVIAKEVDSTNKDQESNPEITSWLKDNLEYEFQVVAETDKQPYFKNGTPYTVHPFDVETGRVDYSTTDGSGTLDETGKVKIKHGQAIVINNIYDYIKAEYYDPVKGAQSKYQVIETLPENTSGAYQNVQYTVTGAGNTITDTNTNMSTSNGTTTTMPVDPSATYRAIFKNNIDYQKLSLLRIEKIMDPEPNNKDAIFKFNVLIDDKPIAKDTNYTVVNTKDSSDKETKTVKEEGYIELKANQIATIPIGLIAGTNVSVKEVTDNNFLNTYKEPAYSATKKVGENSPSKIEWNPNQTVQIGVDEVLTVQVTNSFQESTVNKMQITKVDGDNPQHVLKGAKFHLYEKTTSETSGSVEIPMGGDHKLYGIKLTSDPIGTGDNGLGEFNYQIEIGKEYYLVEQEAPDGYYVLETPILIHYKGKDNIEVYTKVDKDGNGLTDFKLDPDDVKLNKNILSFKISNKSGKPLPNTGGIGTKLFTFSGGAIIAASSLMYGYKKRQKGKKKGGIQ